jgi:aminotransferase
MEYQTWYTRYYISTESIRKRGFFMRNIYQEADRLHDVKFSAIRVVLEKANEMAAAGRKIIHLEIGEPDFSTPGDIINATSVALVEKKLTHYPPNRGVMELRKQIAKFMHDIYKVDYNPADEIMVAVGAVEAIFAAILGHINPGDEVIVLTPAYANYENCINMAGGKCVKVALKEEAGYQIIREDIEAAITDRTKMLVVCNPNNPTGAVLTQESQQKIADIANEHDLIVLTDEIYSLLRYDGSEIRSLASFGGMRERTIVVNGFSKCFAMTGWRLGYVACDKRFYSSMLKIHQYATNCVSTFSQAGLAEAMFSEGTKRESAEMVKKFNARRIAAMEILDKCSKLSYVKPDGAFYIFINVSRTGLSGSEFAMRLLEEKGVAAVPGDPFGPGCDKYIRLAYSRDIETIKEGCRAIVDFAESAGKK